MFSADINIPAAEPGEAYFFGGVSNIEGVDGSQEALVAIDKGSQLARQMLTIGLFGTNASTKAWTVNISGHYASQGEGEEFLAVKVTEA